MTPPSRTAAHGAPPPSPARRGRHRRHTVGFAALLAALGFIDQSVGKRWPTWHRGHAKTTSATPPVYAECPECPTRVVYNDGLWHCGEHGAWGRGWLVWMDADGNEVDDPRGFRGLP